MKVRISEQALNDLEAIGDWISEENPARAYSFTQELRMECLGLADFPERCAVFKISDIGEMRRKVYGNYLIFYVIEAQTLHVVRILHGARDYSSLF